MWKPPQPSRMTDWFSSALAVLALLIFVGGGVSWHQLLQQQKAQDDVRTSRLIGCLEAAQVASDPGAGINACRQKYADRVPALLRSNPFAFVPHRTTASATPVLDAMAAAGAPRFSPPAAAETASSADPAPRAGVSEESSAGGDDVVKAAHPPVGQGRPQEPQSSQTHGSADPPKDARGEQAKGKPAAKPTRTAPPEAAPPPVTPSPRNTK